MKEKQELRYRDVQQKTAAPEKNDGQLSESGDQKSTAGDATMNMSETRSVTAAFEDKKPGKGNRKKDPEVMLMSAKRQREKIQQAEIDGINAS